MHALLAIFIAFGFTFGTVQTVDFDSTKTGAVPTGWSVTSTSTSKPARWQVAIDQSDSRKRHVLAQVSSRSGPRDYTVAVFNGAAFHDGDVSVDLKLVSGRAEQSAGVVWRYQDPANFYFAMASADKDRVGIYKRSSSGVSIVANASVPHRIDDSQWNILKVTFRGAKISLYFGHRKLIEVQDATLDKAGRTGVWTKADTVAYFDNFRLDRKN